MMILEVLISIESLFVLFTYLRKLKIIIYQNSPSLKFTDNFLKNV